MNMKTVKKIQDLKILMLKVKVKVVKLLPNINHTPIMKLTLIQMKQMPTKTPLSIDLPLLKGFCGRKINTSSLMNLTTGG